jgi:hypothetical protein
MKQDLLEILVDIFKSSGYNVIISSQCEILVEKNGHQAYAICSLQPDYEEIKIFSEKLKDCTGIYVSTQKVSEELKNYAAGLGVYVWDRDELALQIGRAILINMEQKEKELCSEPEILKLSKVRGNFKENTFLPPEKSLGLEESGKGSFFSRKLMPFSNQPEMAERTSFETRPISHICEEKNLEEEQREASKVNSYEILNIKSVEPKVSKEQAIIIAKPYLNNPKDTILKFVPFWRYQYNVEAEKRFRSKVLSIVGEGKGFLNALNKAKEEMEIEGISTSIRLPPVKYELRRPIVDKKQAEKILLDLIIEENTREMRFNNMDGQTIIYEHRNIRPRHEDIKLEIELVYIPVWEVKGKRNSLEINAYNARVLEEPVDEDAEFL